VEHRVVVHRQLLAQRLVRGAHVGCGRIADLVVEHRLERIAGARLPQVRLVCAEQAQLDAVVRGALHVRGRTRVVRPTELRRLEEPREPGLVHRRPRPGRIGGIPAQVHVDVRLARELRLSPLVVADRAVGARQVPRADAAVLPQPVLQERPQRMIRLVCAHAALR
jgi:predicted alpha/beta-hydrolase family hydrolase